jgi:pimeloyl-ACP methyl ester carboxylesterase
MTVLSIALVALALQAADTVPPAGAVESPYTIHSGAIELGGTLTVPRGASGRVPVAVIIAGSGPTDRNGNSVMGIRPNSYAQLAWRLAERGIATLRYDKRGLPGTQGTFDITTMTLADFAADARAAAESLSRDQRFPRVVFLGHSEGASLALIAAGQGAPVSGVIHVSGLGRGTGEVLREQLSRQFDNVTVVRYDTAMKHYLLGEQPADVPPQLAMLFVPVNRTFMRSMMAFDPPRFVQCASRPHRPGGDRPASEGRRRGAAARGAARCPARGHSAGESRAETSDRYHTHRSAAVLSESGAADHAGSRQGDPGLDSQPKALSRNPLR